MNNPTILPHGLINKEALAYFKLKKLKTAFSYYDMWLYEHALAFTVAKMMDEDMLAETRDAIQSALENGTDFNTFKKRLKPYLMAKGWWGEKVVTDPLDGKEKVVKLGSTRRLRTIYDTNLQTAYASGQWQRIQENKTALPYLKYLPSHSAHKRHEHLPFYNRILPVDDVFWTTHFPPNGFGCQCGARQLTKKQALRERGEDIEREDNAMQDYIVEKAQAKQKGRLPPDKPVSTISQYQRDNHEKGILKDIVNISYHDVINPRTGEVISVPMRVDPSFAHNHGDRLNALTKLYAEKMQGRENITKVVALKKIHRAIDAYVNGLVARPNFDDDVIPPLWLNPVYRDRHIKGTKEFNATSAKRGTNPSYFIDGMNLQSLLYLFAGTGKPRLNNKLPLGQPNTRELIEAKDIIGYNVDNTHADHQPVRYFEIVYAKDGAHLFPVSESYVKREYDIN